MQVSLWLQACFSLPNPYPRHRVQPQQPAGSQRPRQLERDEHNQLHVQPAHRQRQRPSERVVSHAVGRHHVGQRLGGGHDVNTKLDRPRAAD